MVSSAQTPANNEISEERPELYGTWMDKRVQFGNAKVEWHELAGEVAQKVWLVDAADSPSDNWIAGVFSSKAKAQAWLLAEGAERCRNLAGVLIADTRWRDKHYSYHIEEYEVDAS